MHYTDLHFFFNNTIYIFPCFIFQPYSNTPNYLVIYFDLYSLYLHFINISSTDKLYTFRTEISSPSVILQFNNLLSLPPFGNRANQINICLIDSLIHSFISVTALSVKVYQSGLLWIWSLSQKHSKRKKKYILKISGTDDLKSYDVSGQMCHADVISTEYKPPFDLFHQ